MKRTRTTVAELFQHNRRAVAEAEDTIDLWHCWSVGQGALDALLFVKRISHDRWSRELAALSAAAHCREEQLEQEGEV